MYIVIGICYYFVSRPHGYQWEQGILKMDREHLQLWHE